MTWLGPTVGAILLSLVASELFDWCQWLAERLIGRAAGYFPADLRDRYRDEWLGDLDAVPGKLSKLAWAAVRLLQAPGRAIERGAPFTTGRVIRGVCRTVDVLAAVVMLILSAPLMATLSILVAASTPRTVLTRDLHVGARGREFPLLRYRTRRVKEPSRATWIGRLLERLHLDRLPVLVNLLRGDMSLTGPRPEQLAPKPHDVQLQRIIFLDEKDMPTSREHGQIAVIRDFDDDDNVISVMTMRYGGASE